MNYITGSAIILRSEIPNNRTAGTIAIIKTLINPDGDTILSNTAMTLEAQNDGTYAFEYIFQSDADTHERGKYKFTTQTTNGSRKNLAKSHFFLEDQ